jgi:PGDYG protein
MNIITLNLETDPEAVRVQKTERVTVQFATQIGSLQSREGPNNYGMDDAIVQSVSGDKWVVHRARFGDKYAAVTPLIMGEDGAYDAVPQVILAKLMHTDFSLYRKAGGDLLHGKAGDWVLQYAPSDFGVCEQTRFAQVYVRV